MCKCTHFLPSKPPLSRFLQCLGINLGHPKLVGNAAVQGARPRSCGRTLCPSTTPPSAARRHASTSQSPWARVAAVAGFLNFSFNPCSAATHARGGNMVFGKPLLLRKSNERPSRLTHGLGFMMGKNTAPAADSTAILKLLRDLWHQPKLFLSLSPKTRVIWQKNPQQASRWSNQRN